MYRFVRAQLSGSILSNAFDKATDNNRMCRKFSSTGTAANLADVSIASLAGVMEEKDEPHSTCKMHHLSCALGEIASGEEIEALLDNFHDKLKDQRMNG